MFNKDSYQSGGETLAQDPNKQPKVRIYVYADDELWYKSQIFSQTSSPIFDIKLQMRVSQSTQQLRLDLYDASGLSDSEIEKINKLYSHETDLNLSPYRSINHSNHKSTKKLPGQVSNQKVVSVSRIHDSFENRRSPLLAHYHKNNQSEDVASEGN